MGQRNKVPNLQPDLFDVRTDTNEPSHIVCINSERAIRESRFLVTRASKILETYGLKKS